MAPWMGSEYDKEECSRFGCHQRVPAEYKKLAQAAKKAGYRHFSHGESYCKVHTIEFGKADKEELEQEKQKAQGFDFDNRGRELPPGFVARSAVVRLLGLKDTNEANELIKHKFLASPNDVTEHKVYIVKESVRSFVQNLVLGNIGAKELQVLPAPIRNHFLEPETLKRLVVELTSGAFD